MDSSEPALSGRHDQSDDQLAGAMQASNAKSCFDFSFTSLAITVGSPENTRTFDVDIVPLTTHSRFFAVMLDGPWRESQTRTIALEDDDPELFDIFARFIYSGRIFSARSDDVQVYPDASRRDLEWFRLGRAWVLGDKLQATQFQDAITDAICEKVAREKKWPTTLHQVIYPNTLAAARGVRRLCVDIAVSKWGAKTMRATLKDDAWGEFFEDVATRLFEVQEGGKTTEVDFTDSGCRYHAHGAEETEMCRQSVAR